MFFCDHEKQFFCATSELDSNEFCYLLFFEWYLVQGCANRRRPNQKSIQFIDLLVNFDPIQFNSLTCRLNSIQFNSIHFKSPSKWRQSIQFNSNALQKWRQSIQFNSKSVFHVVQFNSSQFSPIKSNSIQFKSSFYEAQVSRYFPFFGLFLALLGTTRCSAPGKPKEPE